MKEKGFTLIELLVVTAIMVAVSAVVLANQNRFGGQVLLQNFAYDVALSIRQAQVYGLAVVKSSSATDAFGASYGIHFDIASPATSATYDLFADFYQKNGIEDPGTGGNPSPEQVQPMNIKRGFVISDLCVASGGAACVSSSNVDIIFQRPEPDAKISWTDSKGSHNCIVGNQCATEVTITLKSPRGDMMSVTVDNNGQIAVDPRVST